eukprot:scaffold205938_cov28-Tisochrysis_lutea.AAC.1
MPTRQTLGVVHARPLVRKELSDLVSDTNFKLTRDGCGLGRCPPGGDRAWTNDRPPKNFLGDEVMPNIAQAARASIVLNCALVVFCITIQARSAAVRRLATA